MDSQYSFLVYGRSSCPYCVEAVNIFKSKNLDYVFFDHENDRSFLKQVKKFYNHETVPIVLKIKRETGIVSFIGGCDDLKGELDD